MKKKSFYSLHRIDGELKAVWHEGYTDGTYNYYNNGRAAWSAIHPATGIALAFAPTRKECVQLAYADKAQNAITKAEKAEMEKRTEYRKCMVVYLFTKKFFEQIHNCDGKNTTCKTENPCRKPSCEKREQTFKC